MTYVEECDLLGSQRCPRPGTLPPLSGKSSPLSFFCGLSHEPPTYSEQCAGFIFARFLCHLLFSGQVSLFIFPCQQPLRARKSRLNNRSIFPCWRMPGQAGLGARWISPVQISGEIWRVLAALLCSDLRQVLTHNQNLNSVQVPPFQTRQRKCPGLALSFSWPDFSLPLPSYPHPTTTQVTCRQWASCLPLHCPMFLGWGWTSWEPYPSFSV
jgi:hypothetical protein